MPARNSVSGRSSSLLFLPLFLSPLSLSTLDFVEGLFLELSPPLPPPWLAVRRLVGAVGTRGVVVADEEEEAAVPKFSEAARLPPGAKGAFLEGSLKSYAIQDHPLYAVSLSRNSPITDGCLLLLPRASLSSFAAAILLAFAGNDSNPKLLLSSISCYPL